MTRAPEIGFSDAELEGGRSNAHLFLSLRTPGLGKHPVPCYSYLSPQKCLTEAKDVR